MLRTGSQIHIPMTGLGKPTGAQHLAATGGADILLTGHSGKSRALVGIIIEHLPGDAAGNFRTMETVFMTFQGGIIFIHAPLQIQHGADQGGMISIAQRIVGGTGSLNAEHFHGGLQGLLRGRAVSLGIEDHLGIVPLLRKALIQLEEPQIFPENADIVKTPGQKHDVLTAPFPELLHCLRKGHTLFLQPGFLDAGELADPSVQMPVIFWLDHDLELISNELLLGDPNGADLNDLPPDGNGKLLPGRG